MSFNQQESKDYLKELGFNNILYKSTASDRGNTYDISISNDELGVSATIFANGTVTLKTIDGLVLCQLGPFSLPNGNFSNFLRNIQRHVF